MANKFTRQQISEFREQFSVYDKNGDGMVHRLYSSNRTYWILNHLQSTEND